MTLLELAAFGVFCWAVIELIRRSAIQAWRSYRAGSLTRFESVHQRRAYLSDLASNERQPFVAMATPMDAKPTDAQPDYVRRLREEQRVVTWAASRAIQGGTTERENSD